MKILVALFLSIASVMEIYCAIDPGEFVGSETPSLKCYPEFFPQKKKTGIKLEVYEKILREEKDPSAYSIGSYRSGFRIRMNQVVMLEIKVTNISKKPVKPMKIVYEVFGRVRVEGKAPFSIKTAERFLQDIGEFEIIGTLQPMQSKVFQSRSVHFAYSRLIQKQTESQGFWMRGTRFAGYSVCVFEEGKTLIAYKEE